MRFCLKNPLKQICDNPTIGVAAIGVNIRHKWARELRTAVFEQLAVAPKGFPLAPEDDEFAEEIRQMIVDRYRVLFTIKGRKVHVLHIRGPYAQTSVSS